MIPLPNKKYQIIVVDPPWPVKKIQRKSRPNQKKMDYSVMSLDEIMSLDVGSVGAQNSWCFLWTTQKYLPKAFGMLKNWGFRYQRTLTWDKQNGMCLFGFHHRTEFILVGYKGKMNIYPKMKTIPTVFCESSWRKHSVKPNCFYEHVERLGESRIDLFARKQRDGWDVWGDEL